MHIWRTQQNKHLLDAFKANGIVPNKGSWSARERKQLEDNIFFYQTAHPKVDLYKLMFKRGLKANRNFLKKTRFWEMMSFKLCRTLNNVLSHMLCTYQSEAGYETGRFSEKEKVYLKELIKKHGTNWSHISRLMNRSMSRLSLLYCLTIKNDINKGSCWNFDEKNRFMFITKKMIKYNQQHDLPLFKISWRKVSDFVITRCYVSCRNFMVHNKKVLQNLFSVSPSVGPLVVPSVPLPVTPSVAPLVSLMKKTMLIYICQSDSANLHLPDSDSKELMILFDGKYNENCILKQYKEITSELNCDVKERIQRIKMKYKTLMQQSEDLFRRINFESVLKTMRQIRSVAWLKSKYYLMVNESMVNESMPNFIEETKTEDIINVLYNKYCKASVITNNISLEGHQDIIDLVNISDDDLIDLTYLEDDFDNELAYIYIEDSDDSDALMVDIDDDNSSVDDDENNDDVENSIDDDSDRSDNNGESN